MCAKSKPSNRKLGLYTPLPVPSPPRESFSMDFVEELPKSRKGHDCLYVIVERHAPKWIQELSKSSKSFKRSKL